MDVVTGATSTLLPKLAALLQDEYNLQKKVKKEIESTQKELIFMRAALFKVAEVPPERQDHQVKAWASNVKELSYDMEDAVDTYKVRLLLVGGGGGHDDDFATAFVKDVVEMLDIKKGSARHQLGSVIQELMSLTRQLAELRDRYKLDDLGSTEPVPNALTQAVPALRNYPLWTWWRQYANDIASSQTISNFGGWVHQTHFKIFDAIIRHQEVLIHRPFPLELSSVKGANHKGDIKKWLTTNNDGTMDMCFIVGGMGVGKTTFATKLCRDLGGHFDRCYTVTVSQKHDTDDILKIIARQVTQSSNAAAAAAAAGGDRDTKTKTSNFFKACINPILAPSWNSGGGPTKQQDTQGSTEDYHKSQIKKKLGNHSYLLLIDDLWCKEETWNDALDLLPETERSRIIVTTRFPAVAKACAKGRVDRLNKKKGGQVESSKEKGRVEIPIYYMKDLRGKSQDIFESALSESESKSVCQDGDKKSMSNIIPPRLWEMCGEDRPLAIVMLAGLVSCNRDMSADGWKKVCSKLVPDSRKILDGVPTILSHCYNDMPAEIKTCCLYLSMYPKGDKISRKHLTRKWVAEGFVTKKQGLSEEDVAEEYFDNLIKRKFIQPVEPSINLKVKHCQLYELVHEFIVSKAREENFVTVVGGSWTMSMPPPSGRVRRLSLTPFLREDGQKAIKGMDVSHVRSLTVHRSTEQWPLGESLLRPSPIVQVLDLDGCQNLDKRAMKEICRMLLLRYLSLRRTDIEDLHKDIGKLKNLETLDVRETKITKLPDEVCHLQRLSKIFGGDKRERKVLKLADIMKLQKMKSLRILSGIEITVDSESAAQELGHLTNLRKLSIYKLIIAGDRRNDVFLSIQSLCHGRYLQTLAIEEVEPHPSSSNPAHPPFESPPPLSTVQAQCLGTHFEPNGERTPALELSRQLANLPPWTVLTKLRLPVTDLCNEAHKVLKALRVLSTLSSLTLYDKRYTEIKAREFTNEKVLVRLPAAAAAVAVTSSHGHCTQHSTAPHKNSSSQQQPPQPNKLKIFVQACGYENLLLLRFFAPLVPQLNFMDKAMPKLEKLELRFHNFDGIYGIENLEALQEVCLRVHEQADEYTKAIVDKIAEANTTDDGSIVRIIRDDF